MKISIIILILATTFSLYGKESNFKQVNLPLNVSLKIPKNWWFISGDLEATIATAGEAAVELAGLEVPDKKEITLIRANSMPRSTYASIAITAVDADFTKDDLQQLKKASLAALTAQMKPLIERLLKQGGYILERFEQVEVVTHNDSVGLRVQYQRSGPKGSVVISQTSYIVKTKEIGITISYRKKENAIWKPILILMERSIAFKK